MHHHAVTARYMGGAVCDQWTRGVCVHSCGPDRHLSLRHDAGQQVAPQLLARPIESGFVRWPAENLRCLCLGDRELRVRPDDFGQCLRALFVRRQSVESLHDLRVTQLLSVYGVENLNIAEILAWPMALSPEGCQ